MSNSDTQRIATQARTLYRQSLKHKLEPAHVDEFVAIEPVSGDYYLGRTLSEAIGAARRAHPDCLAHAMRVGHPAAVCIGAA